jgi:hypothetical protein
MPFAAFGLSRSDQMAWSAILTCQPFQDAPCGSDHQRTERVQGACSTTIALSTDIFIPDAILTRKLTAFIRPVRNHKMLAVHELSAIRERRREESKKSLQ